VNFCVQRTIDRIIFLRIAEDRGIESYGRLLAETNGKGVYKRLFRLFRDADARYNSGLFHFETEKGRATAPDETTPGVKIDDKVVRDIVVGMYYPESPYQFDQVPTEILGQVYEQFLGKVIRLTKGHNAKVEEKPEVRKAGGVYYTPSYIVDYIVKNTVGKLLEKAKTPKRAEKLRVLDPACGSGSFLLGAYQFLLDWHLEYYANHTPSRWAKGRGARIFKGSGDEWHLTVSERKRILLANIYGVDIDEQAVEVTKLSLLLKVLEGAAGRAHDPRSLFARERALPDLGHNIKCGNSLIGPDYWDGQLAGTIDDDERLRVNAFDWTREFPDIFAGKNPGFDAVIGNPPYIRIQTLKQWAPGEVEFYKKNYVSASKGNYDIYVVFVERGLSLLNKKGQLGFILPHKFMNSQYGAPLRGLLARDKAPSHVVHFGAQQVFSGATTYTCLLFLAKAGTKTVDVHKAERLEEWRMNGTAHKGALPISDLTECEWNLAIGPLAAILKRLTFGLPDLKDVASIFVGLQTSADDVFIMKALGQSQHALTLESQVLGTKWVFEKSFLHPVVSGTDVGRYAPLGARQYILFPYAVEGETARLVDMSEIGSRCPKTAAYLQKNRQRLAGREQGRFKGTDWHRFGRSQNLGIQGRSKLCVPRLVESLHLTYDEDGSHYLDNVDVCGVVLRAEHRRHDLTYLLGVLNSRLLRSLFPLVSAPFRGAWLSANRQFLSQLPIRTIDFADKADVARHDKMVAMVRRMLDLNKRVAEMKAGHKRVVIEREIAATDRAIDELVYELYGLTDKEIRIVEEATVSG